MFNDDRLTTNHYWESVYDKKPSMRLPSKLKIPTRNLQGVLSKYIKPNMKVLEIGFAPGKQLAFVGKVYGAEVSGLDYSENGIAIAKELFCTLNLDSDMRCEDVFNTTFEDNVFDVVYSVGLVEHFVDPKLIIQRHLELVKPGGKSILLIPNYGGIYGRLQNYYDPENLGIHNIDMMSLKSFQLLAPADISENVEVYATGVPDPGLIHFKKKMPGILSKSLHYSMTTIAMLQPIKIPPLCPLLAMIVTKKKSI
jgi:2-polyprenyl-3-methyl-5-hydroxy-6-metoxy-1,4-benzoquinol methylase